MEIKKVITTKHAEATTVNAKYELEFTINDNIITRLYAAIYSTDMDEQGNKLYIGNISSDNGVLNCSISTNQKTAPFFNDVEGFMDEMNATIQSKQAKK